MPAQSAIITLGVDDYSTSTHRTSAGPNHTIEYRPLAGGFVGAFQSLDAMVDAVCGRLGPSFSGYQDAYNKRAADSICRGAGPRSGQIAALFDFVAHALAYVAHPSNQQTLQDCRRTLEIGSGDCVSKSVCLATLLKACHTTCCFIAQCDGAEFCHVYVEALTPGGWLALDPVASDKPMGWRQPLPDGGFETTWEIS